MKLFERLLLLLALGGCQPGEARKVASDDAGRGSMEIISTAFTEGGAIPSAHTCEGADVSPPLAWKGVPSGAKSLALLVEDPDAPSKTWIHWVVYNLPATSAGLPQGVSDNATLGNGAEQGTNDFKKTSYGGPCPPSGTHRYYFKLYALDSALSLAPGASRDDVLKAMQGHVLAQAQLMGRYARK